MDKLEAKKKILKEMKKKFKHEKSEHMNKDLMDGMKVTVMAKDKKGLKEGLSKAQEIMEHRMKYMDGGVKSYKDKTQGEKDFDGNDDVLEDSDDGVITKRMKERLKKDLKKRK